MLPQKIAFIDIETTGASLTRDRIIEIGVLRVENNKLVGTYRTLVNPEAYLPPEITLLTGITEKELDRAPTFSKVKKELLEILDDCIFAAHNARFDYGFIKRELRREEVSFRARNLCTVKLSRQLYPRYRRHGLDEIIDRFGIVCEQRHRAFDDAEVLWKFYQLVLESFPKDKVEAVLEQVLKRPTLPPALAEENLDKLPERPGVYIFYGQGGAPLYIGKSINIHDRVLSHFSDLESGKEMKIARQVESIETIVTAGELGALFKESQLIKELQPLYNRVLRHARKIIVARQTMTTEGYIGVEVAETDQIDPSEIGEIIGIFKSKKQAKEHFATLAKDHELCEKYLGVEKTKGACFAHRLGRCRGACVKKESPTLYNGRSVIALSKNKLRSWPFPGPIAIAEQDEDGNLERHIVDQWCYLGTEKEGDGKIKTKEEIKFDRDIYRILSRQLAHNRNLKVYPVATQI